MSRETVTLRCEDGMEAVVFHKFVFDDGEDNYEINVEDNYCGHKTKGFLARLDRAWHAFKADPIIWTGIYVEDKERMKKFLNDCLSLLEDYKTNK